MSLSPSAAAPRETSERRRVAVDLGARSYDILIGREFLASRVLVDSASTFIADDECNVSERD